MSEEDKKKYKDLLEKGDYELIKNKRFDKAVNLTHHRKNFISKLLIFSLLVLMASMQ